MIKRMHDNSLNCYHSTVLDRATRERSVLEVYHQNYPQGLTDRQVCKILGFTDPNATRPRITELINEGNLMECGKVKDELTKKTVRLVRYLTTEEKSKLIEPNGQRRFL